MEKTGHLGVTRGLSLENGRPVELGWAFVEGKGSLPLLLPLGFACTAQTMKVRMRRRGQRSLPHY